MGSVINATLSTITTSDTSQNDIIHTTQSPDASASQSPQQSSPKNPSSQSIKINDKLLCAAPIPTKKNKWNFQGDYHNNWEKNLIPLNDKMQNDYHKSMITTKYWIRTILENEQNFPEYINIIVAEFFVLPRCSTCGKYDNLWLNIGDGFIGCGRKFYALKSMGGNGCSLTHYNESKHINSTKNKPGPIAVKLGTISANGADVFDYDQQGMIFNADNGTESDTEDVVGDNDMDINGGDDDDDNKEEEDGLSLMELKQMLQHWGIDMNRMYLYDSTFHSNQIILDDTFSKHAYNAFAERE